MSGHPVSVASGVSTGSTVSGSALSMLGRVAALAEQGEAFALATVTWRRGPSSGKGGSRAIVHADGSVEGWLGGACAEPTVVRHALEALQDGQSRLLVLGEPDSRPGIVHVAMACSSEGAMEVFVEPMLPAPDLWVVGRSPAVQTLAALAEALGWVAHVIDAGSADWSGGEGSTPLAELSQVGPRSMVVVATQGHYDEQALEAALATPAAYVGLVASEKRASAVRTYLREQGVADEELTRLHAPAGLDLGATAHHEIAVAVLAELVSLRSRRAIASPVAVAAPERGHDPVCGMTVEVATARWRSEYDGAVVYFCAAGCKRAFDADPTAFPLQPAQTTS